MKNTKEEKEEHQPKLQIGDKNYPKILHISQLQKPGGFYRHQGKGARLATASQKHGLSHGRTAAASLPRPRFCGLHREARAVLSGAFCPVSALSFAVPVSGFRPMVLTNQLF